MYTYPAYPTYNYPGLPCPYPYVMGCQPVHDDGQKRKKENKEVDMSLPYTIVNGPNTLAP